MKRAVLGVAAVGAFALSASAMADLEWVNGIGDASGYYRPAQYRLANGRLVREDAPPVAASRADRPKLTFGELEQLSESAGAWQSSQPEFVLANHKLVRENAPPAQPRQRVTMSEIERLYPDFDKS